jgi:hypothetical protein
LYTKYTGALTFVFWNFWQVVVPRPHAPVYQVSPDRERERERARDSGEKWAAKARREKEREREREKERERQRIYA